ncbi:hypothetical protein KSS94_18610 [Pseudomonas fakonensis]|uniref:Transposase n=1 Tax=Pseudomonas fakonensis TaxID=2842355 RepID=A0ABX8N2P1_9PSED|nr:hypothetical protein [Pseudomonas fakonensis]QXH49948.1 hypothetical protein KSS94_18610 [Pseudomonas fakonensis]
MQDADILGPLCGPISTGRRPGKAASHRIAQILNLALYLWGFSRETDDAVDGTGFAGVRG